MNPFRKKVEHGERRKGMLRISLSLLLFLAKVSKIHTATKEWAKTTNHRKDCGILKEFPFMEIPMDSKSRLYRYFPRISVFLHMYLVISMKLFCGPASLRETPTANIAFDTKSTSLFLLTHAAERQRCSVSG